MSSTSNANAASGGSPSKQHGKQAAEPFQGGGYLPPPQQQQPQPFPQMVPTAVANQSSTPNAHPIPPQHAYYPYGASPPAPIYHHLPHHPGAPHPAHAAVPVAQYQPPPPQPLPPAKNGEAPSTVAQSPAGLNNSSPSTATVGKTVALGTPGATSSPAAANTSAAKTDSSANKNNSVYSKIKPQLVPPQAPPPVAYYPYPAHHPHHPHAIPVYHPVAYGSPPRDAAQAAAQHAAMPPHTPSYWAHHSHQYPHYHAARYAPPPPPHLYPAAAPSNHHLHHRKPPLPHHPIAPRGGPVPSTAKLKASYRKKALKKGKNREGAKSPSEIETNHRDEVQHMGCTCKKTRCLKLYCQCFGIKIYCGVNCRCLECYNSIKYEKQRKDAMRSIMSRNPSAFDTKFRKTGEMVVPAKPVDTTTTSSSSSPPADEKDAGTRAIAHRLGCKCRKSACMKKYCECYAGNVKCNASCRCMGCKNQGPSVDYRDGPPPPEGNAIGTAATMAPAPYPMPHQVPPRPPYRPRAPQMPPPPMPPPLAPAAVAVASNAANSEPWEAAQSLTFLKRGSPASDNNSPIKRGGSAAKVTSATRQAQGTTELSSMPSLASSSEGTSPGDAVYQKIAASPSFRSEERSGADALLIAAAAMTEFASSPAPSLQKLSASFRNGTTAGDGDLGAPKRNISFSESNKPPSGVKKVKL